MAIGDRGVRVLAALAVAALLLAVPTVGTASAGAQPPVQNAAVPIDPEHGANWLGSRTDFERLAAGGIVKFVAFGLGTEAAGLYFANTEKHKSHAEFMQAIGLHRVYGIDDVVKGRFVYDADGAGDPEYGGWHFGLESGIYCTEAVAIQDLLAASQSFIETPIPLHASGAAGAELSQECESLGLDVTTDEVSGTQASSFAALNPGVAYGRLGVFGSGDRPGQFDIAVHESLPNDLAIAAGIISTVPQTPLAHVNLRAVSAGIPNAYVRDILSDPLVQSLMGTWVRLEVAEHGWDLRAATHKEAQAHWERIRPSGQASEVPALDLSVRDITPLSEVGFSAAGAFGAKATGVAELGRLGFPAGTVPSGHAIPVSYYQRFMSETGLDREVAEMLGDESFRAAPDEQLRDLRRDIRAADTPTWIEEDLAVMHRAYPSGTNLRYRSSTNAEDLPHLNGAGLYVSKTQYPDEMPLSKSLKQVYAGLWTRRAFDSREFYRLDHTKVAMAVLVHPSHSDEKVNGVAASFDPLSAGGDSGSAYYVNAQVGEDLVTNPEAASVPEQLLVDASDCAAVASISRSNRTEDGRVLPKERAEEICRRLRAIHDRWKERHGTPGLRFAVEIEFKIDSGGRLVIKQARPWVFGPATAETAMASPARSVEVVRYSGGHRWETALALAEALRQEPSTDLTGAVLVNGQSWTVASLAAWLAARTARPLLFTSSNQIGDVTARTISAWQAEAVFVGSGQQSSRLAASIGVSDGLVGQDVYETAVLVARAGGEVGTVAGLGRTAVVANGSLPHDALAAAPLAARLRIPILLTEHDKLPEQTVRYLRDIGIEHVLLIGGLKAVTQQAEDEISAIAAVTRIAGRNRLATAVKVGDYLRDLVADVCPATGSLHLGLAASGVPTDAAALVPLLASRCGQLMFAGASVGAPLHRYTRSRVRQMRWQHDTSVIIAGGVFGVTRAAEGRVVHPF